MSNTLPDVMLPSSVWTEIYNATGISVGKPLIIQNKINANLIVQVRGTTPTTNNDGYNVAAGNTVYLGGSLSGVWVRCTTAGRIAVMENDEVAS